MADGQVDLGAAGTSTRGGRVRSFVASRPAPQRIGVIGAALILLTAPFGGLDSAAQSRIARLETGQRIDIGPFDVTFESLSQLTDLQPAVSPDPGNRLLVIKVSATNDTDRAESADLVAQAFGGDHTGAVPWAGESAPRVRIFDVDDAAELPASELVNPGSSFTWALVLQQRADADLDAIVLQVYGYTFRAEDPQTLDPDAWVLEDQTPVAEGHVPVESKL